MYRSTGSWYTVKDENGQWYNARTKGVLKMDGITSTNPIAVGDEVEIEVEDEIGPVAAITKIVPRRNYINRQSPRQKHQQHILAANLDQSILMASLKNPKTSQGFIDRFLVVCEMYHVPAIILFNKTDLYRDKELSKLEKLSAMYQSLQYRVYTSHAENRQSMDNLSELLKGKTTLISGHSGVGKSTIINYLLPEQEIKTQEVSGWSGKGMHTTTFATMYDLPGDGKLIDTPGIRELAITGLDRKELSHYFPEMQKRLTRCRYNNCLHQNEPGCMVKQAVTNREIYEERYVSYLHILESMDNTNY